MRTPATSSGFDNLGHPKLSAKNPIPEATCDSKPILVIGKVVLKVILLKFAIVGRQPMKTVRS